MKFHVVIAKHSVTKKSEILADLVDVDEETALSENIKSLKNLKFHLQSLSDYKDVCKSLSKFGLSKNEAKVYVYLAKFGEQKAHKISRSLSLHRTETYKILKRLEEKSLVCRILAKPIRFVAVPIDKALENLIQDKKRSISHLEEEKKKILENWDNMSTPRKNTEVSDEFIQVLKGRNQIDIKVNEIIENAQSEVLIAASDENLLQMFYSGALDDLAQKSEKVRIRIITDSSLRSSYIMKKLKLGGDKFSRVDFKGLPSFVISNDSLLLFLNNSNGRNGKNGKRALWTNQRDIITVLKASFFKLNERKVTLKAAS